MKYGNKEAQTMTEQRTIKSIFKEVNRAIVEMERREAERIRRNYKPAHTRPSAPAVLILTMIERSLKP